MKELPKTEDKVAYICQVLRRETLEPAKREAEEKVKAAERRSEEILKETDQECKQRLDRVQTQIAQEKELFALSLQHAGKQGIDLIKQEIEEALFRPAITELIDKSASKPETIAAFINGVIQAIDKEGIHADLEVILPKTVSPKALMPLLMQHIAERLKKEGSIRLGSFGGGAQIRLRDKNMVIDLSDTALQQLLSRFLRESFQTYLFAQEE